MLDRLRGAPRLKLRGMFARHSHPLAALDVPPPIVVLDDRWQRAGDAIKRVDVVSEERRIPPP